MTERAVDFFRDNQMQVCSAIAPAGQTNLGLAASFNGAVQQLNVAPAALSADNDNMANKQELASRADMAGYSLQQCLQIAPAPKTGDMSYTTAKIGEACTELTSQVFSMFGAQPDEPKLDGNDGFAPQQMMHNPQVRPGMGLGMG